MRSKFAGPSLGAILCILVSHMTAAENSLVTFWAKFGQPYQNAIHLLANDALKPLADAPVPSRIEQADRLIQSSKTQFRAFYNILQPMRTEADQLKQQLSQSIITKTVELGQLEHNLRGTNNAISAATTDLAQSNQALTDTHRQLNEESARLESARSNQRSQEDRLRQATNCIWKRSVRNRRFLDNVWREFGVAVKNVGNELGIGAKNIENGVRNVVNLPCKIGSGIESARDAVRSAESNVASNRQRVTDKQASVNAAQNRIVELQRTKTQQEEQKRSLDNQIAGMRSKLQVLAEINVKMASLVTYLASLFDTNKTLQNAMTQMISIDALLEPLQHIAGLIGSFSGQNTAPLQASVASIRQSMLTLNSKLPQYPFDERVAS